MVEPGHITGLVLAGGQARRFGGEDKGLLMLYGKPLVAHALQRLAPQVNSVAISANRHLDQYAQLGHAVWPDTVTGYAGPLAGMLSGLTHCATPWLATAPCDAPFAPSHWVAALAQRLAAAQPQAALAAVVVVNNGATLLKQPTFCLLHQSLAQSLQAQLARGQGAIRTWLAAQGALEVELPLSPQEAQQAFCNLNDWEQLNSLRGG